MQVQDPKSKMLNKYGMDKSVNHGTEIPDFQDR